MYSLTKARKPKSRNPCLSPSFWCSRAHGHLTPASASVFTDLAPYVPVSLSFAKHPRTSVIGFKAHPKSRILRPLT